MLKPILLILAVAGALAPVVAPAGQTAVMGGGFASPPQGSPGPGVGATAPPDQGAATPPDTVGPIPVPRTFKSDAQHCAPAPCVYSDGGG